MLLVAWSVAFGVATLVVLEVIAPTGSLPNPLLFVRGLPSRLRRQRRYVQIVGIATRHGLSSRLGLGAHRDVQDSRRLARGLRLALTDGGVTFVKFGQMLSTRADLVGEDLAAELSLLTSEVEPVPWEAMRTALEGHIGAPLEEVFADLDPVPLAAASVGQVHAGRLHDDSDVVVKIQRPGANVQVAADLDILRRLARRVETRTDWGRDLGVSSLVEGFAVSLDEELDYRVEAANVRAIAPDPGEDAETLVHVPFVHERYSGRAVLVMERVRGVPISRADAELRRLSDGQRADLAASLLRLVLRQIVGTGVFHADLHGGNVLLQDDGRLALLDFGSVGRLDRSSRDAVARLMLAVDHDDAVAATDAVLLLLDRPEGLDDRRLEREIGSLLVRVRGGGATSGLFGDLFGLGVRHGFTVPGQVAAVFRAVGALEGTLAAIDPRIDFVESSRVAGAGLFTERFRPEEVRRTLESRLLQALPLVERLPRRLDAVGRQLEDGELSVRVRLLDDAEDRAFVTGLVREITMSIIAAACAVIAAVLLVSGVGPTRRRECRSIR
ncbi:ubiquinone biosynthesis protein UbiB [Mobilicoccus caccae]|uniref:Ubiquinone biosynthesis protein UbiB n=1 Tax=Mobilicoccus caccae TaxID=1859295 RepID=A0ABQ6IUN6_9MICO|nr:ubiquinone biosynthesis protein UbiB [Mobilicoccus caccae]